VEIKKAAADKDVRETAPLETAREHLGQIASRIRETQDILERAQVMENESSGEPARAVRQGSRVTLQDLATGEMATYLLVDPREANLLHGKLSIASPVGQAALDQRAGQELVVTAPKGTLRYCIVKVE
jgi:transcription elongation factor GreA